jgi:hypothetical protein
VDAALAKLTGAGPASVSADGRLDWYDLRPVAARVAKNTTPGERLIVSDALLEPVDLAFGAGFSFPQADPGGPFRWAATDAQLALDNPLDTPRKVRLTATLFGGAAAPSTVTLTLPGGRRRVLKAAAAGAPLDVQFVVAPGRSQIALHTDGPAAPNDPNDIRDKRLRVSNPRLREDLLQTGVLTKIAQ